MFRSELTIALFIGYLLGASACGADDTVEETFRYPESFELGATLPVTTLSQLLTTIPPDGAGLPAGRGDFSSGREIYEAKCMACHGDRMQGTENGMPLVGGRGSLTGAMPKKTVESYWPYATSVFSYIRNAMPVTAPGSLTDDETYSLMAYLLGSAGIIAEDAVMDASTLPGVRMPNRDGFVPDDRPDVAPNPE